MTISAKIIADSISPEGIRLTTMQLRYPRFIHAEELTHRILETQPELIIYEAIPDGLMYDQNLSRNASSSRAIPVNRMIEDLRRDPAMPVYWGSNKPGMQAGEELKGEELNFAKEIWLYGMEDAIGRAEAMINLGLHKQIANRILEPWAHINVVVTATEWDNFFTLRAHKDAQPEIHELALEMFNAMAHSHPRHLKPGEWHLPYISKQDLFDAGNYLRNTKKINITDDRVIELLRKVSVARCARVSYLTHDGRQTSVDEDIALYEKLIVATPVHASPCEHLASPDVLVDNAWKEPQYHGNFYGWKQFRRMLPGGISNASSYSRI